MFSNSVLVSGAPCDLKPFMLCGCCYRGLCDPYSAVTKVACSWHGLGHGELDYGALAMVMMVVEKMRWDSSIFTL